MRLLEELPLEVDCLLEDHALELLGGEVVQLHVEGEGLRGHGLVGGVVVGGEVGVGQGPLDIEAGRRVEAEQAVQDGAQVLVAGTPGKVNWLA